MRTRTNSANIFSWKKGIVAVGASLVLAAALAAQQPPPPPDQGQYPPPPEQQQGQYPPQGQYPQRGQYPPPPQGQENYGAPVPSTLTIPAGTTITGQLTQYLSSHRNHSGDAFTMTLSQPVIVNGWVVARPGQMVNGEVTIADKGGSGKGPSQLGLALTGLNLVDGQQVNVNSQLIQWSGPPKDPGRSVGTMATTTILGTIIGAAIGRGTGAAIGAGVGATAGAIAVLKTPGQPTVLAPETTLSFRTGSPVTINTNGSERAYLPVSPEDYQAPQARARYNAPPPPPYGRPYPYPYPYAYGYPYYPYPYWGGAIVIRPGYRYYGRYRR